MKSIILSVKPQEAVNILNGEQKIIIKKSAPKPPFKMYIYCTKIKRLNLNDYTFLHRTTGRAIDGWHGKVVAEFVCESVIDFYLGELDLYPLKERFLRNAKLTEKELKDYIGKGVGKALHITDLKIYDKQKELSEFRAIDKNAVKNCEYRERVYNNPDYTNGAMLKGGYVCNIDYENYWCNNCITMLITRPPQDFMYVEELK